MPVPMPKRTAIDDQLCDQEVMDSITMHLIVNDETVVRYVRELVSVTDITLNQIIDNIKPLDKPIKGTYLIEGDMVYVSSEFSEMNHYVLRGFGVHIERPDKGLGLNVGIKYTTTQGFTIVDANKLLYLIRGDNLSGIEIVAYGKGLIAASGKIYGVDFHKNIIRDFSAMSPLSVILEDNNESPQQLRSEPFALTCSSCSTTQIYTGTSALAKANNRCPSCTKDYSPRQLEALGIKIA